MDTCNDEEVDDDIVAPAFSPISIEFEVQSVCENEAESDDGNSDGGNSDDDNNDDKLVSFGDKAPH